MNLSKYYPRPTTTTPLKPGECFLAQYRDTNTGKRNIWIGVICSKNMWMSGSRSRGRPPPPMPRSGGGGGGGGGTARTRLDRWFYPVYLPRKGELLWISYLKLFRIDRESYPEFDACEDYADFCAVLRLALVGGGNVRFWEGMVGEDGRGLGVEEEGMGMGMGKKGVEHRVEEEVVVMVDMETQQPAMQNGAVSGVRNGVGVARDQDQDRLQAARQAGGVRASINGETSSRAPLLRQSGDGYTPANGVCGIDLHEQTQRGDVPSLLLNGDGEAPLQQSPSEQNGNGHGIGVIPNTFPNKVIDDIGSDDVGQRATPPAYHPPDTIAQQHVDAADDMTIHFLPNSASSPAPPAPPASPVHHGNRVNVYIGRGASQVVYNMAFKAASRCEIIRKALVTKDGVTEARPPILETIKPEDFEIVKSFLEMKEYSPTLVATRKHHHHLEMGMDIPLRFITYQLEGLVTVEDHEGELMRTGHIYLMARGLQLPELQDLCLRKILLGFPVIRLHRMLQFIGYVLLEIPSEPKPPAIRAEEEGPLRDFYYRERDPLSEYLVEWMAVHISGASMSEGPFFWETMEYVDGLKHAVLLRAAEIELEGVTRKFTRGIGVQDRYGLMMI
ncbi:hypothetical protein FQN51_008276 [Onygenales sp. PD_10]|nr:hypothetical protein FQN51_008276 [Onygenales sp. PD_10]